jgi:hypothetical protein
VPRGVAPHLAGRQKRLNNTCRSPPLRRGIPSMPSHNSVIGRFCRASPPTGQLVGTDIDNACDQAALDRLTLSHRPGTVEATAARSSSDRGNLMHRFRCSKTFPQKRQTSATWLSANPRAPLRPDRYLSQRAIRSTLGPGRRSKECQESPTTSSRWPGAPTVRHLYAMHLRLHR